MAQLDALGDDEPADDRPPVPPIWTRTVSPGFTSRFTVSEGIQPSLSCVSTRR